MKTSILYALMGPRGAGATTMIKMATEMGINYIPVYTTEWLHARSRRGILLKRMEQEAFNQQRFFAHTGWRGFQYGWYKQDILEAMAAYRCNLILINEAVIPTFRNSSCMRRKAPTSRGSTSKHWACLLKPSARPWPKTSTSSSTPPRCTAPSTTSASTWPLPARSSPKL